MQQFVKDDIELLADYFYELFLPRFLGQSSGSILIGTTLEISKKMTSKIGLALLFENKIRLSELYFLDHPYYLPYALFHEMTHLWLYHCGLDPGHNRRFYQKMSEFSETGYLVDPEVHIHTRLCAEAKFIYTCKNCGNRWHLRESLKHEIFCGLCWKNEKARHFAALETILPSDIALEFVGELIKEKSDCA